MHHCRIKNGDFTRIMALYKVYYLLTYMLSYKLGMVIGWLTVYGQVNYLGV